MPNTTSTVPTGTVTPVPTTDTVTNIQPGDPSTLPASGWWKSDTRANGTVALDARFGAPPGFGSRSVVLTTGPSTPSPSADKAQAVSYALAGLPLTKINNVSYWAYRSSASTGGAPIDLSLNVSVTGTNVPTGFATLVYEPYRQSGGIPAIQNDVWQQWNATATTPGNGLWWTNRIANPNPGSQAFPQPWAAFQTAWADASVRSYGFNLGSANPNMIVGGDGLLFGDTLTDF